MQSLDSSRGESNNAARNTPLFDKQLSAIFRKRRIITGTRGKTLSLLSSLILIIAVCLCLGACSLHTRNHTPPAFPWEEERDSSSVEPLRTDTPENIFDAYYNWEHNFVLEITADAGISNIHPYVTVNGTEHPMELYRGAVWKYENQDQCTEGYDYYFRTTYRRLGYQSTYTQTIGSESQPLRAEVTGYNGVTYRYATGPDKLHLPSEYPAPVLYLTPVIKQKSVTIQNLRPIRMRISHIRFIDAPEYQVRPEEFELLHVTETMAATDGRGYYIECGETMWFSVIWNGPYYEGAKAAVEFCAATEDGYMACPTIPVEAVYP